MSTSFRLSRASWITLAGLSVGIVGLLIQWAADPSKFSADPFPPGIAVIIVFAGAMLATSRWWWHPIFAVLIGLWITVGGTMAGQLPANLRSDNTGTIAGNLIMAAGLALAILAGIYGLTPLNRHELTSSKHA
jgi:hypothetical protein